MVKPSRQPAQIDLLVASPEHQFGGGWTEAKLVILRKYLDAYLTALKKQPFKKLYIDAFAGSGYVSTNAPASDSSIADMFADAVDEPTQRFFDGSAAVALSTDIGFDNYVFIEKNPRRAAELTKLNERFPDRSKRIIIREGDANEILLRICRKVNWKKTRAVVFLDPYGMQVEWTTVEAIAKTRGIDLWFLAPIGLGFNRMLTANGKFDPTWEEKITKSLGTTEWRSAFYSTSMQTDFLQPSSSALKTANYDSIEQFFIQRLKSIFPFVAAKPRRMINSMGSPMFSLCFAAGNERGGEIALRIAQHLLRD